ncbi:MAG: metal ABC transporter permease [Lachnospirales bacterium]
MEFFEALFNYKFIQNAYIVGILLGFVAPILGSYVVVKRLSLIVEGVSHIATAGICFSLFLSKVGILAINPIIFGVAFSLGGAALIEKIRTTFKEYSEISIPVVISLSTAFMILFTSLAGGFNQDFSSFMFGNILTTTNTELYLITIIFILILILGKRYYRELLAFAIDEEYCKYSNINTRYFKIAFNILIALVITVSIKVVGMLLVSALVIIPVSSASKISNNFKKTIIFAILFSEISVLGGLIMSYYINIPSGATIVFINIIIFIVTILIDRVKPFSNSKDKV